MRFQLNLPAPPSWWSDFAARTDAIIANSEPKPNDWYTSDVLSYHYGPLNPQLYSVDQAAIAAPALVAELANSDRGPAVYNTTINQIPAGVSYGDWATARLMAAANQLIGTAYEHLHLPQFDPNQVVPAGSFKPIPASTNSNLQSTQQLLANPQISGSVSNPYYIDPQPLIPGIDCTDFSAYIYSLALGYQMHSGTSSQITFPSSSSGVGGPADAIVLDSSGSRLNPRFFYSPNYGSNKVNASGDLDTLIQSFQPGDLLYIGPPENIVHVVMWLGAYGTNADGSPSTVPLVISSHDNTPAIFTTQNINFDSSSPDYGFPNLGSGETIETYLPPPGVQILPFTDQNWFYSNFQVAMRLLPDNDPPAVPAPAAPLGLLVIFGQRCRQLRRRLAVRPAIGQP